MGFSTGWMGSGSLLGIFNVTPMSCLLIYDDCLFADLWFDVGAQFGAKVNAPSNDLGQLFAIQEVVSARSRLRIEVRQYVDIALRREIVACDGPEEAQPHNAARTAKRGDLVTVDGDW